jgi:WD40 repeat protein
MLPHLRINVLQIRYGINTILPLNEFVVGSGDEEGYFHVWDLRTKSIVQKYHEHEDMINAFYHVPHKKTVVSVGSDGYLSVYDLRKPAVLARSDQMETEMTCILPVREGKKLLIGHSDGTLSIWDWGWWGDFKDRFACHPGSVEAMVSMKDESVFTGCADGIIRYESYNTTFSHYWALIHCTAPIIFYPPCSSVSILPNKLLGVCGQHEEFPIESLSLSHDSQWLASCSHDSTVRFWEISKIPTAESSTEVEGDREQNPALDPPSFLHSDEENQGTFKWPTDDECKSDLSGTKIETDCVAVASKKKRKKKLKTESLTSEAKKTKVAAQSFFRGL